MASTSTSTSFAVLKSHKNGSSRTKLHPLLPTTKPSKIVQTQNFLSSSTSSVLVSIKTVKAQPANVTGNTVEFFDEEIDKIKRLQNGSDVRGVAMPGEKGKEVNLTPAAVEAIAESFGEWVGEKLQISSSSSSSSPETILKVSLGRDPRVSGGKLSTAVFAGLDRAGCAVFDMGLATTPACFMSTVLPPFNYDASIMMTASHLPYRRNGLKFFTKRGGLTSPEVEEICDKAARKYVNRQAKVSTLLTNPPTRVDFMSAYAAHLREIIKKRVNHPTHYDTPLEGFQIIVNAGNGSGGFFTTQVLDKLGADTFGSLHLDPDGMFPNHIPNPEDKTAMSLTTEAVLTNSADLGIVFDTDVDRSGVVDNEGNPINGDKLIALMSAIILRENPETTIVTDARTSVGLSKFITERGGKHCLYRVGYRNVIDKGVQLNEEAGIDAQLMMETSGHGAFKENYYLDDGAYMVVKIIIEMVRMRVEGMNDGIGSLVKDLEEPVEAVELRMDVMVEPRDAKGKAVEVIELFRSYIEEDRLKGWELDSCGDCYVSEGCLVDLNENNPTALDAHMYRVKVSNEVDGEHGWVHLRQSIHNPNIAVNMQSSIPGGCQSMSQTFLHQFLVASGVDNILDISQVQQYSRTGIISG